LTEIQRKKTLPSIIRNIQLDEGNAQTDASEARRVIAALAELLKTIAQETR